MGRRHRAAGRPARGPARADHEDHVLGAQSLIVDERYDPHKPPGYVVAMNTSGGSLYSFAALGRST